MKRSVLLAVSVAAIAIVSGCNRGGGAGGGAQLQPGQWEMVTQITNIEVPGAPPEMAEAMRAAAARQRQTQNRCITPQEAANPGASMMNAGQATGCNFTEQNFSGGTMRLVGTCQAPGGQGQVATRMEGTYTATTMEARITAEVTMANAPPGSPRTVRSTGTLMGRRTGDCAGGTQ
jgi:hypothetical protein